MRIGIDCRLYNQSGLGRYIRNLVNNLQAIDHGNEYFLFLLEEDLSKLKVNPNFHKVSANIHWYTFAEQTKFAYLLYKYNLDLVHFPHFNVPVLYFRPFVVTIHDLIHQHFTTRDVTTRNPLVFMVKKTAHKIAFAAAVQRSQKILVPSRFVQDQLIKEWYIEKNKITVTYEAVEDQLLQTINKTNSDEFIKLSKKWGIKTPYLFYIGNAQPHKNLERLIESFLNVKKDFPKLSLVLAGPKHFFWEKIKAKTDDQSILFLGYVTDEELITLYKNSLAFVLPSLEEGFGIPVLEAMSTGTPVVASKTGSIPEIGENAVLYFDPYSIKDISSTMIKLIKDQKLRQNLIHKGKERVKCFSWLQLATKTLHIYSEIGAKNVIAKTPPSLEARNVN